MQILDIVKTIEIYRTSKLLNGGNSSTHVDGIVACTEFESEKNNFFPSISIDFDQGKFWTRMRTSPKLEKDHPNLKEQNPRSKKRTLAG